MAQVNGPFERYGSLAKLRSWEPGQRLAADDLNVNFTVLAEMAGAALLAARTPSPAVVVLEMALGEVSRRVAGLEKLTAMHERQRNEKQWAPLSHLGAIIVMVQDLRQQVEAAIARIDEMHASLGRDHDDLHRRLLRIEQQPDPAAQKDLAAIAADHKRVALEHDAALAEIVALKHAVRALVDWTSGEDQRVNRVQYAPLAYFAELVRRIEKLEARVPGVEKC